MSMEKKQDKLFEILIEEINTGREMMVDCLDPIVGYKIDENDSTTP